MHNVFDVSHIGITLHETLTDDGDDNPNTNAYTMTPGAAITKDPVVTITQGSEDAWVFVKLDKSSNFDTFMTYDMADGWTALDGVPGVYWRTAAKADNPQDFAVLANHTVTVRPEVTAYMLNTITSDTRPTLTVTAYAVQQAQIATPLEAWALAQDPGINP